MTARVLLGAATALVALAGIALVLAASPARPSAATPRVTAPDAAGRLVARRALALTAAIPTDGYTIRFSGPREGVRAQVDRKLRLVEVFLRPGDPVHRVAHDLAHELGHAFDDRRMTDTARARYLRLRGAAGATWWPRGAHSDLDFGAGDFAEVFARCWVPSPDFRSTLRPAPADACAMLPAEARPR